MGEVDALQTMLRLNKSATDAPRLVMSWPDADGSFGNPVAISYQKNGTILRLDVKTVGRH
jgi:hypothetical protein